VFPPQQKVAIILLIQGSPSRVLAGGEKTFWIDFDYLKLFSPTANTSEGKP
jgi:hypothetical protein